MSFADVETPNRWYEKQIRTWAMWVELIEISKWKISKFLSDNFFLLRFVIIHSLRVRYNEWKTRWVCVDVDVCTNMIYNQWHLASEECINMRGMPTKWVRKRPRLHIWHRTTTSTCRLFVSFCWSSFFGCRLTFADDLFVLCISRCWSPLVTHSPCTYDVVMEYFSFRRILSFNDRIIPFHFDSALVHWIEHDLDHRTLWYTLVAVVDWIKLKMNEHLRNTYFSFT